MEEEVRKEGLRRKEKGGKLTLNAQRDANEPQQLSRRTRQFALRIIRLYSSLPKSAPAQVMGKQVLRSGTSVGAHYSEANFAKSDRDFINKIETALQELEETAYWLDLLGEAEVAKADSLSSLKLETRELIAIFVSIVKKVKAK